MLDNEAHLAALSLSSSLYSSTTQQSDTRHIFSFLTAIMPNRAEFLATGLLPVTSSNFAKETCSICTLELTEPVKTLCKHVFDFTCLEKWLTMKGRNTCPTCRKALFALPGDEDYDVGSDRRGHVIAAVRTSRVSDSAALSVIQLFGADLRTVTASAFQKATAHATQYLAQPNRTGPGDLIGPSGTSQPQRVSGRAVIRPQKIIASFLAMANLVPALARAQNRRYTDQQVSDWELAMTFLWHLLQTQDGKKEDVSALPVKLRLDLLDRLMSKYRDAGNIEFFFEYTDPSVENPFFDDLDLLLDYLAVCCWSVRQAEEAEMIRQKANHGGQHRAQKDPKGKKPCAVM